MADGPALDLTKPELDVAVQKFGHQAQGADVALFYYAGHGVQVRGSNFLVPVNANATRGRHRFPHAGRQHRAAPDAGGIDEAQSRYSRCLPQQSVRRIRDALRGQRPGADARAGRNADLLRDAARQRGVRRRRSNSPYTKALATTLGQGLDLFQTFNQVGLAVKRPTGGQQQPWVSSSPIDGTFYFAPPKTAGTQTAAVQSNPPVRQPGADPFRILLQDTSLAELSDRLYERNFDTEGRRTASATSASPSASFRSASASRPPVTPPRHPARLRSLDDLEAVGLDRLWAGQRTSGAMAWDHGSRKKAVEDARASAARANVLWS